MEQAGLNKHYHNKNIGKSHHTYLIFIIIKLHSIYHYPKGFGDCRNDRMHHWSLLHEVHDRMFWWACNSYGNGCLVFCRYSVQYIYIYTHLSRYKFTNERTNLCHRWKGKPTLFVIYAYPNTTFVAQMCKENSEAKQI